MKNILIILSIFSYAQLLIGQDTQADTIKYWKFNGLTSLNFSQVKLVNWSAGGDESYSASSLVNLNFGYNKDRLNWINNLDAGYGVIKQGENDMRKTDDNFDFTSKLGYRAISKWHYYFLVNFKTQFDEGFNYGKTDTTKISDFMAPGYLNMAFGMEYKVDEDFYFLISPLTGKTTFVFDDSLSYAGAFGVDPGDNVRSEFGASIKVAYSSDIMENVTLNTKLELFSNLLEDFIAETDINWEVLIAMKINKYLSANITTRIIYDDDIKNIDEDGVAEGPKVQFKEVFGLGISYKF